MFEEPRDCGAVDKYIVAVTWSLGSGFTDCKFGEPDVDPAEGVEAQQVHTELYSAALTATEAEQARNLTYSNYFEDTRTISRIEGKNAVVRALSNGSTESQTRFAADQAIEDYYSQKQVNYARQLGPTMRTVERIYNSAASESGLSADQVVRSERATGTNKYREWLKTENRSITLINGSTADIPVINASDGFGGIIIGPHKTYTDDNYINTLVYSPDATQYHPIQEENTTRLLNSGDMESTWQKIKDQANSEKTHMDTFVNQTYPKWEAGMIDSEDLVDPYLGAREMDPTANGSTWATRSLTALGISPPANVSNLERMEVRDETTGAVYNGTLMAQADPANASGYAVGSTYNTSNINGDVFMATNEGPRSLDGRFTILSADRIDGGSYEDGEQITYDRPDYSTTNLSKFKQMHEDVMALRADLEAREQRIEENAKSGTGGLFGPLRDSLPFGGGGLVVALGAIVVLGLVTRN
ncbi:hypothetical protein [Halorientalis regularis]|nr:hypothetical protein [Halorientalis regularis]